MRLSSRSFGPYWPDDALAELTTRFGFSKPLAADLLNRARVSITGMAREPLDRFTDVWVSSLVTQSGKFMIETDESR